MMASERSELPVVAPVVVLDDPPGINGIVCNWKQWFSNVATVKAIEVVVFVESLTVYLMVLVGRAAGRGWAVQACASLVTKLMLIMTHRGS